MSALNAGGGSAHKCWDNVNVFGVAVVPSVREGCHDATGALAGGQIGFRWQSGGWVFGVEGQGDWSSLKGSNASIPVALLAGFPLLTNQTKVEAIGLLHRPGRLRLQQRALVREGRRRRRRRSLLRLRHRHQFPGRQRARNPLGRRGRHRHRIRLRAELVGRPRVRSSVHGQPQHQFPGVWRSPEPPASTASRRMSTWAPCA